MGLCKCRVVTSLFCFEHRVNVCESCIVKDHPKCMIKSYLQWLQDADFTTKCTLCQQELASGENTIRLPCYDVFHSRCVENYVLSHSGITPASELKCPACHTGLVPDEHNASPVAKQARERLQPILAKRNKSKKEQTTVVSMNGSSHAPAHNAAATTSAATASAPTTAAMSPIKRREIAPPGRDVVKRTGRGSDSTAGGAGNGRLGGAVFDTDADKYARRPANAWFAQVVGNRFPARKNTTEPSVRRAAILLVIGVIFLFTIIHLMTKVQPSDHDPLLDPKMNPNLRSDEN